MGGVVVEESAQEGESGVTRERLKSVSKEDDVVDRMVGGQKRAWKEARCREDGRVQERTERRGMREVGEEEEEEEEEEERRQIEKSERKEAISMMRRETLRITP